MLSRKKKSIKISPMTEAINKCFVVLKLQKVVSEEKSKVRALRHFRVGTVDATFHSCLDLSGVWYEVRLVLNVRQTILIK